MLPFPLHCGLYFACLSFFSTLRLPYSTLSVQAEITAKMSDTVESKESGGAEKAVSLVERGHDVDLDTKAAFADYKADAIEAENAEHRMGVLEAVRAYPMASFWAFVMSFTIVSCPFCVWTFSFIIFLLQQAIANITDRLWSRTMCSSSAISSPYLRSKKSTAYSRPTAASSSLQSGSLLSKCPGSSEP